MSCDKCHEQMVDVLYGEELRSQECFHFFQHLDDCAECRSEYEELLSTRRLLSDWTIEEPAVLEVAPAPGRWGRWPALQGSWWNQVLKVAATFLILVGVWGVIDRMGLAGSDRRMVSQKELMQMVNDLVVLRQAEERELIGRVLIQFADDLRAQQKMELMSVSEDLQDLNRRYLRVMEETTENLRALASR